MHSSLPRRVTPRAAWIVLAVAIAAYFMAVVHRSVLGIAGVEALERFEVQATALAMLSVVQIAVYAALQLPSGALLDRYGPRTVLVAGSVVMAGGQALMAVADDYTWAIVARVLLGLGDAPVFVAANRLIIAWFPPRRVPLLSQSLAVLGQVGQLATAIPVAWALHAHGWEATFGSLAAIGLVVAAVALAGIRVPPASASDTTSHPHVSAGPPLTLREAIRPPGVRLGFWTHWSGVFSANTVALLWGVPFMVQGQGLSPTQASALLSVMVLAKIATAPLAGVFTGRHPLRRSWLVLAASAIIAVAWAGILIPSTPRPMWQLTVLMMVIGIGGPASVVGLDYARTFGRSARLGTAVAYANIGGFAATVLAVLLIGVALQLFAPGSSAEYTLDHYRAAFALLAVPWIAGVVGVLRWRRRTREAMAAGGVIVPPLREAYRQGRRL